MDSAEASSYCRISAQRADLPTHRIPKYFTDLFRQAGDLSRSSLPHRSDASTGILTCLPSVFPLGYTLGPD